MADHQDSYLGSRHLASREPPMPTDEVRGFIKNRVMAERDSFNLWKTNVTSRAMFLEAAKRHRGVDSIRMPAGHVLKRGVRVIGGVYGPVTTLVSQQALTSARHRDLTWRYLDASGVPTASGRAFRPSQYRDALVYFESIGDTPVRVVVPAYAEREFAGSEQVENHQEFARAWESVVSATSGLPDSGRQVWVGVRGDGLHVRVFVVGEDVVAAVVKTPMFVIGDGISTLSELVCSEIAKREECGFLRHRRPERQALQLYESDAATTVPLEGSVELLHWGVDPRENGELSFDVLDVLGDELKGLAVDAAWAFPGLLATAVDLTAPELHSSSGALVSKVVADADLTEFLYPAYGRPRRVGTVVVDKMSRIS